MFPPTLLLVQIRAMSTGIFLLFDGVEDLFQKEFPISLDSLSGHRVRSILSNWEAVTFSSAAKA